MNRIRWEQKPAFTGRRAADRAVRHVLTGRRPRHLSDAQSRVGLILVALLVLTAVLAPVIAPHDPLLVDVARKLRPPGGTYWLGTDHLGRCVASRLIWGSRYSLACGAAVLTVSVAIGVPIGLVSGYAGGRTDLVLMRVIDLFTAMPSFIVALAIAGTLGANGQNLLLAMSCVYWAGYARMARALTIRVKEQSFVLALHAGGCSGPRILFRHILRNISPAIAALATMEIGSVILAIAGFSFIGIGVQPPAPEWGIMLSDSRNYIQTCPRLMLYPGLVIVAVVMAFNLLGSGIGHGSSGSLDQH